MKELVKFPIIKAEPLREPNLMIIGGNRLSWYSPDEILMALKYVHERMPSGKRMSTDKAFSIVAEAFNGRGGNKR